MRGLQLNVIAPVAGFPVGGHESTAQQGAQAQHILAFHPKGDEGKIFVEMLIEKMQNISVSGARRLPRTANHPHGSRTNKGVEFSLCRASFE